MASPVVENLSPMKKYAWAIMAVATSTMQRPMVHSKPRPDHKFFVTVVPATAHTIGLR
jgi:hypothetical protein